MIKVRLIKLLSQAKKFVFLQVFCQWISLLCQIAVVFWIIDIIQKIYTHTAGFAFVRRYGAFIACCLAVRLAADKVYVWASYKASADVKLTLRDHIYRKLLRLGASYREDVPTAEIVQLASDGVEQLEVYFGKYLAQFIYRSRFLLF